MSEKREFLSHCFHLENVIGELKHKLDDAVDHSHYHQLSKRSQEMVDDIYMDIDNAKTRIQLLIQELYK